MAVLVTADVPGQTLEGYQQLITHLEPLLREARGFIAHGAGPVRDGWRVFEIWDSQEHATQFFATHIQPNLPPGITPKRTLLELHTFLKV